MSRTSGEEKCCDSMSCCHGEETTCFRSKSQTGNDISDALDTFNGPTPCCHSSRTLDKDDFAVCFAVILENGSSVVVFDAKGVPKSYGGCDGDIRKLCFSTHGGSADCDDLLTPCFDQDGNHGVDPESACRICPVKTPHLHAHLHDPKVCRKDFSAASMDTATTESTNSNEKGMTKTLSYLATRTLHPVNSVEKDSLCTQLQPLLDITVSKQMPNECNSRTMSQQVKIQKLGKHDYQQIPRNFGRRILKVRHEDHFDYLVHNKHTGQLHLEHPCVDCGKDDIHGRFRIVTNRVLQRKNRVNGKSSTIPCQIFEIERKAFNLLEFLSDLFTPSSDRVAAVENLIQHTSSKVNSNCCNRKQPCDTISIEADNSATTGAEVVVLKETEPALHTSLSGQSASPQSSTAKSPTKMSGCCSGHTHYAAGTSCIKAAPCDDNTVSTSCDANVRNVAKGDLSNDNEQMEPKTVRTKISCKGICCASEVPIIRSILDPLSGIHDVKVNATLKQVLIDHNPSVITAAEVEKALNDKHFAASIIRDGGAARATQQQVATSGRSQFHVQNICCASEIPAIHAALDSLAGITAISINTTNKLVNVDHVFSVVSAQGIIVALRREGFRTELRVDGAKFATAQQTLMVKTVFSFHYATDGSNGNNLEHGHQHHDHHDTVTNLKNQLSQSDTTVNKHKHEHHPQKEVVKCSNSRSLLVGTIDRIPEHSHHHHGHQNAAECVIGGTTGSNHGKEHSHQDHEEIPKCMKAQSLPACSTSKNHDHEHHHHHHHDNEDVAGDPKDSLFLEGTIVNNPEHDHQYHDHHDGFKCSKTQSSHVSTTCGKQEHGHEHHDHHNAVMCSNMQSLQSVSTNINEHCHQHHYDQDALKFSKAQFLHDTTTCNNEHGCDHHFDNQDVVGYSQKRSSQTGMNASKHEHEHHHEHGHEHYHDHGHPNVDKFFKAHSLQNFLQNFGSSQIESVKIDESLNSITVVHNPFLLSAQHIADTLRKFQPNIVVSVDEDGADPKNWCLPKYDDEKPNTDQNEDFTYPRPTVVLSGIFWIVSMLSYIGGPWSYLRYVGLLSVALGLPIIAIKAWHVLKRFHFDTNCLMLFASLGAVALQDYTEAAAVVFLFTISEWLEVRATSRARFALKSIVQLRPEKANIVHPSTNELIVVAASAVPVGALVSVKTGEKIPCDGIVVEGQTTVNEASLTGESRPILKGPGDEVSGGTLNSGFSQITVRTTFTTEDSAVSRLIRLVEEAQANRSQTEKLIDEFAKIYTPIVLVAAIFMVTIPWAFGPAIGRVWTNNGLVFIVVACPCALVISTPVSYVAGLAATARKGVLIKGGANLESLGLVKHIMFDKTGTLTSGNFALLHLKVIGSSRSREDVFQYLTLMEERASHPVAQAIVHGAKIEQKNPTKNSLLLENHTIIAGEGVMACIDGLTVHVGNERLFTRLGLLDKLTQHESDEIELWKTFGGTVGFMSIQGEGIVCSFCAADQIRPEAANVVSRLKKQGFIVTMLTGDNESAATTIGNLVGLHGETEVCAGLLPEEKLQYVENVSGGDRNISFLRNLCSSKKLVLMCGDGVNDAPALAAADIGVAIGAGAALAMETADVTLLDSNLEKLEYCLLMGRRVITKIKQNVIFSMTVKLIVLGFALAGRTNLWAAIGSDVGAMLLVTLNAMLLLPARQQSTDVLRLSDDIERGRLSRCHNTEDRPSEHIEDYQDGELPKAKEPNSSFSSSHDSSRHTSEQVDNDSVHSKCRVNNSNFNEKSCQKGCCGDGNKNFVKNGNICNNQMKSGVIVEREHAKPLDSENTVSQSFCCSSTNQVEKPTALISQQTHCCAGVKQNASVCHKKSCHEKQTNQTNQTCQKTSCQERKHAKDDYTLLSIEKSAEKVHGDDERGKKEAFDTYCGNNVANQKAEIKPDSKKNLSKKKQSCSKGCCSGDNKDIV